VNLNEIVQQCQSDSEDWFPDKAYDTTFMALAMAGEVGEVCNEIKKVERGSATFTEARDKIAEESIDVFIYLCNLFGILGVDAEELYKRKREFNAGRFGVQGTADNG
jgi:NTP pyrophosphatase (non-canonical NTP hydrolase)